VGGTPEAFAGFIRKEAARWTPAIRAAGVRAEHRASGWAVLWRAAQLRGMVGTIAGQPQGADTAREEERLADHPPRRAAGAYP
jgi:hypothetical protein